MKKNYKYLKDNSIHVGNNINEILQNLGVSKVDFAKLIGKTREHTYKIIANSNVNTEILQILHNEYDIPYSIFFSTEKQINIKIKGDSNEIKQLGITTDNKKLIDDNELKALKKEIELLQEIVKTKDDLINVLKSK